MKRLLVALALLAALAAPAAALAHPLGNFTVNRHTEIELSGGRVYIHYALDLAEIPTFQLGSGFVAPASRARRRGSSSSGSTAGGRRCACSSAVSRCGQAQAGSRRSASTRSTSRAGDGLAAHVPRPQLRRRGSAGGRSSSERRTAPSCARERAGSERER